MATVKITITDAPGGVTCLCESSPSIPMDGRNPDVENLTDAQATAVNAMIHIFDSSGPNSDWRVLLR